MKLYVVGIGPGAGKMMTPQAAEAIADCQTVVGYDAYIEFIGPIINDKKVIATGMKKEAQRVALAIDEALAGRNVALVSSGDAGIYGMAGLAYEMVADKENIEVVVIPGITAASSSAAELGAPLMNDFAVISLSDLLTPWDVIKKRLAAAAAGDFVIALYNPKSMKRRTHLSTACEIIMRERPANTPCGFVRNAGRMDCFSKLCSLGELPDQDIDMFTTVIIGNSSSEVINGKLVTKRGYRNE